MKEWLDLYPPDKKTIIDKSRKDTSKKPPPNVLGLKRVKAMDIQETLDLHGSTAEDAETELLDFIKRCRKRGLRKVLVVHGKGLHSQQGSVLRPLVKRILTESNLVLDFGRAKKNQGDSGATWFILKGN